MLSELWEKTGLKKIFISEFEKVKDEEAAEKEVEAIFEMVLNRLTKPESKLQAFNEWRKSCYFNEDWSRLDEPSPSSTTPTHSLSLNDYYRAMDTLSDTLEHIEESSSFKEEFSSLAQRLSSLIQHPRTLKEKEEMALVSTASQKTIGEIESKLSSLLLLMKERYQ